MTDLVAIEPQVFDVLEFLIEARDRVVSRDDLLDAVWHGRIVSEATLSCRLNSARTAIGDNGAEQRLIRAPSRARGPGRGARDHRSRAGGAPPGGHPAPAERRVARRPQVFAVGRGSCPSAGGAHPEQESR